jgi:hypothetical protein
MADDVRERLARLIDPFSQGAPSNGAAAAAGRIIAAGWTPPDTAAPIVPAIIPQGQADE